MVSSHGAPEYAKNADNNAIEAAYDASPELGTLSVHILMALPKKFGEARLKKSVDELASVTTRLKRSLTPGRDLHKIREWPESEDGTKLDFRTTEQGDYWTTSKVTSTGITTSVFRLSPDAVTDQPEDSRFNFEWRQYDLDGRQVKYISYPDPNSAYQFSNRGFAREQLTELIDVTMPKWGELVQAPVAEQAA